MTQDDWSGPLGLGLLRERMNRLFDEGLRRDEGRIGEPSADVYSTPQTLVVTIELPGVPESGVVISAEGQTLVVRGEHPRRRAAESHRLERASGSFQCRVQLPPDAVGSAHVARHERGVLTIEIPEENMTTTSQPESESHESDSMPDVDFAMFALSLASSVLVHLGELPHPEAGDQPHPANLPLAKQTIDILGMLRDKTRGNLTQEEAQVMDNILYDLRMKYVAAKKR